MWFVKAFSELNNDELYDIMQLRSRVFVVEQKRLYQDLDANDKKALHLFKTDDKGAIVAYARIFLEGDGKTVTFGRVVTSPNVRGQGVGQDLLNHVMEVISEHFPGQPIEIEAQTYVQKFYEKADFHAQGHAFIYKLTPHIKMVHQPLK